jgi:heptosyltransferase II
MRRELTLFAAGDCVAPSKGAQPRILLLSAAGLGDFVLGTPAIRAIRQSFPEAPLWFLTIPEVKPLADRCPYLDIVRTLDLRRSRSAAWWTFGRRRRELRQLARELRAARFDLAVNLYGVGTWMGGLRLAVFLWTIGASRTAGRYSQGRGLGYDLTSRYEGHEVEAQLEVARLIGAVPTNELPELWVTPEDRTACVALMREFGIETTEPFACLHAGSARPEACWPLEQFAVVGQRLAWAGAKTIVVGASGDQSRCATLAKAIPNAVSAAGRTPLPLLAALLERTRLLVTNDSGPMHMAAALGTPVVVPFGPADPARFGPRGRATKVVLSATDRGHAAVWWKGISAEAVSEAAVRVFCEARIQSSQTP